MRATVSTPNEEGKAMRSVIIVLCTICVGTAALAQSYAISEVAPVAGVSFYSINRTSAAGPSIAVQYTPNRFREPFLEFYGGLVLKFSNAQSAPRTTTVSGNEIAGFRSPLPNGGDYISAPPPTRTALSFGYGFFGADAKLFLASGSVRPYLSAGVQLVMYSWYSPLTVAVAPDVRAGLDIEFSSGFSAFGEVRHVIGLPGVLSPPGRAFDNATMLAFGFTFLPSFD
jgi:hypothetical protein